MDKQKQIEEMCGDLQFSRFYSSDECGATECDRCKYYGNFRCGDMLSAECLIEKGYRKIKANEVVRKIDEGEQADWLDGYKVGFREGVQALHLQAKEKIDEIAKEITEGGGNG